MATGVMERNSGRCGPLCQHPACWESGRWKPLAKKYTQYERYVQQLLRTRRVSQEESEDGLPVLTVQTVDPDAAEPRKTTPPATITPSHTAPPQPSPPHQIHNVEVLLEAVQFSPSSNSLSVSPVLIWRAGRPRAPVADRRPQNSVAVKNLSDALNDTSRPATTDSVENSRQSSKPQSRQIPESLDFLQDIPQYLVADIIRQLQTPARAISCHLPSSLICDLSTGEIYRNNQPSQILTDTRKSHPIFSSTPPLHSTVRRRRRKTVALPTVSEKTSFSRALSHCPTAVLSQTDAAPHKMTPPPPRTAIQTLNHSLLLPPTPHRAHTLPHLTRYPLGNPVVARRPQAFRVDPLFAPYPAQSDQAPQAVGRFLHVTSADIHHSRLVTLHCSAGRPPTSPPDNQSTITQESPPDQREVHLPPISPDHMQLGAEIVGDQLVLERAGEHVVHPLREPSLSSVGGARRPETTPSKGGVVNGTLAPPPTSS